MFAAQLEPKRLGNALGYKPCLSCSQHQLLGSSHIVFFLTTLQSNNLLNFNPLVTDLPIVNIIFPGHILINQYYIRRIMICPNNLINCVEDRSNIWFYFHAFIISSMPITDAWLLWAMWPSQFSWLELRWVPAKTENTYGIAFGLCDQHIHFRKSNSIHQPCQTQSSSYVHLRLDHLFTWSLENTYLPSNWIATNSSLMIWHTF